MARISMKVSVKTEDGDYVAGEEYTVTKEVADTLVVKGYAEGDLSRDYSDDEKAAITNNDQTVGR